MPEPQRLQVPELTVVTCRKVCKCGKIWQGNFFREWAKPNVMREVEGARAVVSDCGDCIDEWERARLRREIEGVVIKIDSQKNEAPKWKVPGILRSKARELKNLRSTYAPGSVPFGEISQRIFKIEQALESEHHDG